MFYFSSKIEETHKDMKETAVDIMLKEMYHVLDKDTIDDDFTLIDDISKVPYFDFPYKVELTVATICLKGHIKGYIDMKDFYLSEKHISVVLPGQIVEYTGASDDFSALFIIMSKKFSETLQLNIQNSVALFLRLKENPVIALSDDELALLTDFYSLLKKTVKMTRNAYRSEMVRLLLESFFYITTNLEQLQKGSQTQKTRKELLFDNFYNAVLKHHKESREVIFYAKKLCITPKYLSIIIKEVTGRSANDWINEYVIMEAKALLKSTNQTIQEISDQLGFPNQSFFGKYFKKHAGIPPKEYRGR